MSTTKDLYGVSRVIPTTAEKSWGSVVTTLLSDICTGLDGTTALLATVGIFKMISTSTAIAAGGTLTQTHPVHIVTGNGGAVTLSGVTAITAPANNALLVLIGGDNTNTVTIPDSGSVAGLNGEIKLYAGDILVLVYNTTQGYWCELARNN